MLGTPKDDLLDRPFWVGTPTVPGPGSRLLAPVPGARFQAER